MASVAVCRSSCLSAGRFTYSKASGTTYTRHRTPLAPGRTARSSGRASSVAVRAQQQPPRGGGLAALQQDLLSFVERYDPVATGVGALAFCGYFMAVHGQPAAEALPMAALATIAGMVANELLFLAPAAGAAAAGAAGDERPASPRNGGDDDA